MVAEAAGGEGEEEEEGEGDFSSMIMDRLKPSLVSKRKHIVESFYRICRIGG